MKKWFLFFFALLYGGLFIYSSINNDKEDKLYNEIVNYANENNVMAIDASYDIIKQQIPGINGYKVNIDESYNNMKEIGRFDEDKIVYETLSPVVSLNDLKKGAIYQGNEKKKMVSININVAWGEEYLLEIMELLSKYETKVTFFVEGKWAEKNTSLMEKMVEEGHILGNHSYSHADFAKISKEKMIEEINKTNEIIKSYTNSDCLYFAPPSGSYNKTTLEVVKELNMQLIMWNVDTIDWQKPSVEVIKNRVFKKVDCGSIILMHPTNNTKEALEAIILEISKRGLKIAPINELLSDEN